MNATHSSFSTRMKVGIFTVCGLLTIVVLSIFVNGHPYWWRPCQLVSISVEDATGLKEKAPIRSLGIDIGFLKSVNLSESHVTLGICVTAPVEVLPTTKAYIRGEGFLGDKFVELRPVKNVEFKPETGPSKLPSQSLGEPRRGSFKSTFSKLSLTDWLFPKVWAAPLPVRPGEQKNRAGEEREVPVGQDSQDVQHLVNRVDDLVNQMSGLTDNLKQAINPEELRKTMKQLNSTLENASKTLAPEGGINQTAQRTLAKLEDSIEQLRDIMTRVNKGEGSVGMLLNDPIYAQEIRQAIKNINRLLNKVADVRFVVNLGVEELTSYNGTRAWFQLGIWPKKDRYYLLGIAIDPRGKITNTTTTTTTTINNLSQTVTTQNQVVEPTGLLFTGMLGKVFFDRWDLSVGVLYGDGAGSLAYLAGPAGEEDRIQIRNDIYFRNTGSSPFDDRVSVIVKPFQGLYAKASIESFRTYQGQIPFSVGAGLSFDDEDIKLLFALK